VSKIKEEVQPGSGKQGYAKKIATKKVKMPAKCRRDETRNTVARGLG